MAQSGELLSSLTDSLESALESLPETTKLQPPLDGISLLDTKNELLLSYLQSLVFLIILKLRNQSRSDSSLEKASDEEVVKNLVALRTYLEKGVRPLESRLKYQLDKLLFAATEDSSTPTAQLQKAKSTGKAKSHQTNGHTSDRASGSNSDSDASDASHSNPPTTHISDLAHRPNPSSLLAPRHPSNSTPSSSTIYRPPHLNPILPPTSSKSRPKPRKSHLLDSFVREEFTDAPLAEPSIGSGSGLRGKEREKEEERRGYEEQRLVRLPGEKGGKKRRVGQGEGFGEDDLLVGVDFGGSGGKRKRGRVEGREEQRVGEAWEKRAKRGAGRKRR